MHMNTKTTIYLNIKPRLCLVTDIVLLYRDKNGD